MHDRFGFEQQSRRGDSGEMVEGLDQQVRFGQVFATGAHLLPDKGDGVEPQNIDARIGDEQHLLQHRAKHGRIAVVQIPLKAVERRPDPVLHPVVPGEVSASHGRENFAQRPLVLLRFGRDRERGSRTLDTRDRPALGLLCPLVIVGRVIEDKVQHQTDAGLAQIAGQHRRSSIVPKRGSTER